MSLKRKVLVAGVVCGAVWVASKLRKANKGHESGRFEQDTGPIELDIDSEETEGEETSEEVAEERQESQSDQDEEEGEFVCTEEGCSRSFDTEHGRNVHEGQVH